MSDLTAAKRAEYLQEFAEGGDSLSALGISREEFVRSRSIDDGIASLVEIDSARSGTEELQEHYSGAVEFDSSAGLLRGVALLGPDSRNGYRYDPAAMERAVPLYQGKHVFLDHGKSGSGRSVRDLAGVIENPRFDGTRIRADIRPVAGEPGRVLRALAESGIGGVGMSHVVRAKRSADRSTVEEIDSVISVDAVCSPATTASFAESIALPGEPLPDGSSQREPTPLQLALPSPEARRREFELASFRKEFVQFQAVFDRLGLTEDEYIQSRLAGDPLPTDDLLATSPAD